MDAQPHAADNYRADFNTVQYRDQNYAAKILAEDAFLIEILTRTSVFKEFGIAPKTLSNILDLGNGGAMVSAGLLSPYLADDGQLTLADVGNGQIHEIGRTIRKGKRGNLGIWQKYQDLMSQNETWKDAIERACKLAQSAMLTSADIEPNSYDGGSMCYVSESVTNNKDDFRKVTAQFFDGIRSGGLVMWCSMIGSQGYDSAGSVLQACWIDLQDMIDLAEDGLRAFRSFYCPASGGMRPKDGLRYSGTGVVVGVKKWGNSG